MASIVAAIEAWKVTAKLAQQFVEAYLSYKVRQIESDYSKRSEARHAILIEMEKARKSRDTQQLIALNYGLALIERGKL